MLFGAERTGLTNDDIESSHVLIRIPANQAYLSLNLAMAVQLVSYELFRARGAKVVQLHTDVPLATPEQMDHLYVHLAQVMEEVEEKVLQLVRSRTSNGKEVSR